MNRLMIGAIAVAALVLEAGAASAQSPDARMARLAVAELLKGDMAINPLYKDRRVVLDTTRLTMMFDGHSSIRPNNQPSVKRSSAEFAELALRGGMTLSTDSDVIRCEAPTRGCAPADVVPVKVGEPLVVGDTAYVLFQISWVNGKTAKAPTALGERYDYRLLATLHRDGSEWHPILVRQAGADSPGRAVPMVGLSGASRPGGK